MLWISLTRHLSTSQLYNSIFSFSFAWVEPDLNYFLYDNPLKFLFRFTSFSKHLFESSKLMALRQLFAWVILTGSCVLARSYPYLLQRSNRSARCREGAQRTSPCCAQERGTQPQVLFTADFIPAACKGQLLKPDTISSKQSRKNLMRNTFAKFCMSLF